MTNLRLSFLLVSLGFGIISWALFKRYQKTPLLAPFITGLLLLFLLVSFGGDWKPRFLDPDIKENLCATPLIKTEKIVIPGYPNAFNPSLIPYQDGYLLSFRVVDLKRKNIFLQKLYRTRDSYTGIVKLDQNLQISSKPYLLQVESNSDSFSTSIEDSRLFREGEKIYLFFNDYLAAGDRSVYCPYMVELVEKEGELQPAKKAVPLHYEQMTRTEKNWSPFLAGGKLCLIYSGNPHLILELDKESGLCKKIGTSETKQIWKWGEIRGGTPGDLLEEDFLTFFHSFHIGNQSSLIPKTWKKNYTMGAYLFESKPPFAIKKITPFPLGSLEDYEKENRQKVMFPGGMVIEGNTIHVVWGKNNKAIYLSTFDKEKLLSSMTSM